MLNRPDKARNMGDGWETRRRRDDGNDHAIIRLALPGKIRLVEIDTAHFKYNASAEIALSIADGECLSYAGLDAWAPLLARRPLQPDTRHVFALPANQQLSSFVRLDAFPDGGISRVRLWGAVDPTARRKAGYRWFNALPASQATHLLMEHGMAAELAARLTDERPLVEEVVATNLGSTLPHAAAASVAALKAMLEGTTDMPCGGAASPRVEG
jgi:allantoicase